MAPFFTYVILKGLQQKNIPIYIVKYYKFVQHAYSFYAIYSRNLYSKL